jgi:hypothetical protein
MGRKAHSLSMHDGTCMQPRCIGVAVSSPQRASQVERPLSAQQREEHLGRAALAAPTLHVAVVHGHAWGGQHC